MLVFDTIPVHMDSFDALIIFCWLICALLFGPILFILCVYLPELPVRYIKHIRSMS
ncbi:uncharacterized protein LOC129245811 [Anastrepha obliqua]|uniref:uncharacterized protein LOC129245811 n=1 Tax=Anastrepha obliqua TaxID=95512 RepID=UPI002409D6DF|nr:uncharacterized protein LOC129245811 [Anastrepha obliqua]